MQTPEEIEAALSCLMPSSMSGQASRSIEEMLDGLAGGVQGHSAGDARAIGRSSFSYWLSGGLAAAIALGFILPDVKKTGPLASVEPLTDEAFAGLVLVGESEHIESMTDEGWLADPDGAAMQAVRIRAVGANRLRDEETGIVVEISEPRDEVLLMPVSAF